MEANQIQELQKELDLLAKTFDNKFAEVELENHVNDEGIRAIKKSYTKKEKDLKKIKGGKVPKGSTALQEGLKMLLKEIKDAYQNDAELEQAGNLYLEEKKGFENLTQRVEDERKAIGVSEGRLQKMNDKKNEILETQKKEMNAQTEKVETFRKGLQERLSTYHLERTKKVKKFEIEQDENKKLEAHLDKIEVEIQNQQATYDQDYETKKKDIEDHKVKLTDTLCQVEDEVKKLPEFQEEKTKVEEEYNEAKEIDDMLTDRYESLSSVMSKCDRFFKDVKGSMKDVKKVISSLESEIKQHEEASKRSNESLIEQVKTNLNVRMNIDKEVVTTGKYEKMINDFKVKTQDIEGADN